MTTETRPTGEQLRFISSLTGNHILDTYLESAEKGGRSLADLLSDIFDEATGVFRADLFEFRIGSNRAFQYRVGDFPDANSGWQLVAGNPYLFRARGAWSASTEYAATDIVTNNNSAYYCVTPHTSGHIFAPENWAVMSDAGALNAAISSAQTSALNAASSATSAAAQAANASNASSLAAASSSTAAAQAVEAATSASAANNSAIASQNSSSYSSTKAAESASSALLASDWAIKTGSPVAGGEYSSKHHAQQSANSATTAQAHSTSASNSATLAATSASNSSNSADSASSYATSAASSADSASASASAASAAASDSASSAAAAASSEASSATKAAEAQISAQSAASSQLAAAAAQAAAEQARDQTLSVYDSFDDRYLGAKSSDPTTDNDGNGLLGGALYFNTTTSTMKVYTGTSWVAAYVSGETGSYVSISGGTMTGPLTLHGNAVANLHAIPKQQFDIGLAAKADTAHTHAISDVSNLQTALDSKANSLAPNFAGKAQFATGQNFASINIGINTVSTSLADGDLYISGDVLSFRSSGVLFSVASINSGNTYASGARQTMQHTTASSGLRVAPNSYDINTPVDGDIWYNGAAAKLKFRLGSTSQNFAFEGHSHAIADVTNLQTVLDAKAGSASPSFTGLIDFTNGSVRQNAVSIPALAIDCSTGNYFTKSISVNSAFTFTNVPVAGKVYAMTIEIDHVSGSITWPTSVVWPNATAPTLTTGKKHLFFFLTDDGGVVWRAASQTNYAS